MRASAGRSSQHNDDENRRSWLKASQLGQTILFCFDGFCFTVHGWCCVLESISGEVNKRGLSAKLEGPKRKGVSLVHSRSAAAAQTVTVGRAL